MKTKISILALITIIALTACMNKKEKDKTVLKKNNALIIGNPFDYGIENILIFPVGSNYKPVVTEQEEKGSELKMLNSYKDNLSFSQNKTNLYDRTADKEYVNTNEDKFDIRNILFYDLETGLTYPLVTDTLHILSFAMHKEFGTPWIFYRIVKNDNNNDSIFNSEDPVMLFISDLYGKNLIQVTPSNEQFIDYTYYKKTQTILIKTIIDGDKDKRFTNFDETNFREMKILEPAMSREIFKKSLKDSLKAQLRAF
jgi:hypothetical protein